jgi:hypothetical protein
MPGFSLADARASDREPVAEFAIDEVSEYCYRGVFRDTTSRHQVLGFPDTPQGQRRIDGCFRTRRHSMHPR